MISQVVFIEFCWIRARKGTASPFTVECMYVSTKKNATSLRILGYLVCSFARYETLNAENFVILQDNGSRTTLFLRSANYCSCIARAMDVMCHRKQKQHQAKTSSVCLANVL